MSLLLALLASAAPAVGNAPTAAAPTPDEQALFAAFRKVCSKVRNLDGMNAAARKAGWQAVAAEAHPRLASLVNGGREAVLKEEPGAQLIGAQFSRNIGARQVWLVTSRYTDGNPQGYWGNGCRVYDFEASGPIAPGVLRTLMGRANTGTMPLPDGETKYLWEPGWKSGHSVEVSYVTGTDPVSRKFGLKGLVLTAQAIGRISK